MKKLSLVFAAVGIVAGANADVIYNGLDSAGANTTGAYFSTDGGINQGHNYGGQTGQLIYNTGGDLTLTTVEGQFLGFTPASYTGGSSEMLVQLYSVTGGVPSETPIAGDSALFTLGNGIDGHTFSEVDWTYTQGALSSFAVWNVAVGGLNWAITPGSTYLISMQNVGPNSGFIGINNGTFTGTGNNGSHTNGYVRDLTNNGYQPYYNHSNWIESGAYGANVGGFASGNFNMLVVGSPAPEPVGLCALGLGLIALLRRRR